LKHCSELARKEVQEMSFHNFLVSNIAIAGPMDSAY
jgi:hypothetical protein